MVEPICNSIYGAGKQFSEMNSDTGPQWTLENLHSEGVVEDGDSFLVDKNHPAMQLIINNMDIMSCPKFPVQMELSDGAKFRLSPLLFSKSCETIKQHSSSCLN